MHSFVRAWSRSYGRSPWTQIARRSAQRDGRPSRNAHRDPDPTDYLPRTNRRRLEGPKLSGRARLSQHMFAVHLQTTGIHHTHSPVRRVLPQSYSTRGYEAANPGPPRVWVGRHSGFSVEPDPRPLDVGTDADGVVANTSCIWREGPRTDLTTSVERVTVGSGATTAARRRSRSRSACRSN